MPGAVSSLRAAYYYFPGDGDCFRAGLRVCWTTPSNGLLFLRPVSICLSVPFHIVLSSTLI